MEKREGKVYLMTCIRRILYVLFKCHVYKTCTKLNYSYSNTAYCGDLGNCCFLKKTETASLYKILVDKVNINEKFFNISGQKKPA